MQTVAGALSTGQEIKPLTSIRGIAAFWVFLYHCSNLVTDNRFFTELERSGYYGVDIFFILSGYILSHVHQNDFPALSNIRKNGAPFLILRLARIYPMHLLTLLLLLIFMISGFWHAGVAPMNTNGNFLCNILLLQATPLATQMSWNVVAWSISVEWFLYVCFPLFAFFLNVTAKSRTGCFIIFLSLTVLWLSAFYVLHLDISSMYFSYGAFIRGALDFMMGGLLLNLCRLRFLKTFPWDIIAFLDLYAIAGFIWLKTRNIILPDITAVLLFTILIYALANLRGLGLRIFSTKFLVFFGTISYSFYMLHWIYLSSFFLHNFSLHQFTNWRFLPLLLGLIAISALCYRYIETPARQWAHRKFR